MGSAVQQPQERCQQARVRQGTKVSKPLRSNNRQASTLCDAPFPVSQHLPKDQGSAVTISSISVLQLNCLLLNIAKKKNNQFLKLSLV